MYELINDDGFADKFAVQIARECFPGLLGKPKAMAALEAVLDRCEDDEAGQVRDSFEAALADPSVRAKSDEELAMLILLFDPRIGKGVPQ